MRMPFCILIFFIFNLTFSKESGDSSAAKLKFSGSISFNTNGMAPIPAFSLGKPALIGTFTLQKNRFSYDGQIAYGLNLRPWIIDNWLHYRIIYKPKFELRTGVDFAMFFSEYAEGDHLILQGQQYIAFEIAGIIKFSPTSILSLMYWSDNGQDYGTISGSFYNIVYERVDIELGKTILLAGTLQLFYLAYTGNNDGLFISTRIAASIKKIPLSLFFQATQPLTTNIDPNPGFRWNAGLGYLF